MCLYPDAIRLDQGIEINTFVNPKMNHMFVVMPIPEAENRTTENYFYH